MNQAPQTQILARLENKSALIGIVGLGYVGLPLLLRYVEAGYRVLGLDIEQDKIDKLTQGQTYIKHLPAATKPFGFVPYYPGPGLGGHCIFIDPSYLTWKAREYGINTRYIELDVNSSMPQWVVGKVAATQHDAFDWALIRQHAQLIVDTRSVYLEPAAHVVKA